MFSLWQLKFVVAAVLVSASIGASAGALERELGRLPPEKIGYIAGVLVADCHFTPVNRSEECLPSAGTVGVAFVGPKRIKGAVTNRAKGWGSRMDADETDEVAQERRYYFCQALPEGRYTFTKAFYNHIYGGGERKDLPGPREGTLDLPFEVNGGRITHLGGLRVASKQSSNIIGIVYYPPDALVLRPSADAAGIAATKCPNGASNGELVRAPLRASDVPPRKEIREES